MLFHTNILLGITFFILFGDIFSGGNNVIFLLLVMLGSILPDIDSRHSKINRWSGIIGVFITFFSKHRGLFHSLLFHSMLFFVMSYFFNKYYAIALFMGYVAHIAADGITPMGITLFYPISSFKIRGPIRSGRFFEGIISVVLFIFIVIQLF